jgi:TolB-like protein
VSFEDGRVIGDGVNVASRVRPLAEPGGVAISDEVQHSVQNQENLETRSLGLKKLKNVPRPVEVFAVLGTPEAPRPLPRRTPVPSPRRFPLAGFGVAALVVLAAGIAWLIVTIGPDPHPAPIRSIAVLPLENLSGDPEQEYFADGMTNEIISEFAKIGSIRVPSWTTVRLFKDPAQPLPEIAEELGVDAIVVGTVLRAGDRVRITLQLLDARRDRHLWAQSYQHPLSDVLALQGEIAKTVAGEVEAELTPAAERALHSAHSVDPQAHDAYLRGMSLLAKTTVPDALKAIEYFERAIEVDPGHARAYSGMARAYSELAFGHAYMRPHTAMPRARAASEKAIELDDSLGSAHSTLGQVLAYYDWEWERAESEHRRAAQLSPGDARVVDLYGLVLSALGRHEEALVLLERAVSLGSLELVVRFDYGLGLLMARDYERARDECLKVLEVDPAFPWAFFCLGTSYLFLGPEKEVYRAWTRFFRSTGRDSAWLGEWESAYLESGLPGAARYLAPAEQAASTRYVDSMIPALFGASFLDPDVTFELLERAYEERAPMLAFMLGTWPTFDPIRSDPRFQDLLRRINYPEAT